MSDRPDGQPRRYALTSDDDWFAAPSPRQPLPPTDEWLAADRDPAPFDQGVPAWRDEDTGYDDPGYDERPVAGHPFGDRRFTPIVAAVGIVVVIVVAIVVVRSLGGSGAGTSAATTPTFTDTSVDTTIDTTAVDTTATDTTATDTTATDTTATDTTGGTTTTTTTTPTTTTPTTTVTEVPAGQSLKPGMSGSSVLALQQALVQLGYDPGTPDGSYGPGTTQAVTAFQGSNELTQDGVAGPATLDAINAQLSRG